VAAQTQSPGRANMRQGVRARRRQVEHRVAARPMDQWEQVAMGAVHQRVAEEVVANFRLAFPVLRPPPVHLCKLAMSSAYVGQGVMA